MVFSILSFELNYCFFSRAFIININQIASHLPTISSGSGMNRVDHSQNRTHDYFKKLTTEQKMRLYELYKVDFLMFGYDPIPYL